MSLFGPSERERELERRLETLGLRMETEAQRTAMELDMQERTIKALERQAVVYGTMLRERDQAISRLTAIIVDMKREGFHPPTPFAPMPQRPEIHPDLVAAVTAKARPGEQLYADLMANAEAQLSRDIPLDDVIRAINRGGAYYEDDDDDGLPFDTDDDEDEDND